MSKRLISTLAAVAALVGAIFPSPAYATSCTANRQLNSEHIEQLHVDVRNAATGEQLMAINQDESVRTASVMKLLTAAVVLDVLGPNHRITTGIYADSADPSQIYLVGAGDITLSRMPAKITSYYAKAPKVDTLTRQVRNWAKKNSVEISAVHVDSSLFGGSGEWHETWSRQGITRGYMAPVSALQLDAARLTSPKKKRTWIFGRTEQPVIQAGELLMESLNKRGLAQGIIATEKPAPEDAVLIASVRSRPMREWVAHMLRVSDNSLAEAMARVASLKAGFDGSMQSLTPLYSQVLAKRGLDVSGINIVDASGLSRENQVPASLVSDLLQLIDRGVGRYELIEQGLPISGEPGSLRNRFSSGSKAKARGAVVAKTGYILTGYTLAGFMTASDGSELIFTVYNLSESARISQRGALDNLVYRFYQCGARLAGPKN